MYSDSGASAPSKWASLRFLGVFLAELSIAVAFGAALGIFMAVLFEFGGR